MMSRLKNSFFHGFFISFNNQEASTYFQCECFFLTSDQQTVNYKKKYPSAFKRRFTINQPPPRLRIQKNVLAFYFFSLSFLYFCVFPFILHDVDIVFAPAQMSGTKNLYEKRGPTVCRPSARGTKKCSSGERLS